MHICIIGLLFCKTHLFFIFFTMIYDHSIKDLSAKCSPFLADDLNYGAGAEMYVPPSPPTTLMCLSNSCAANKCCEPERSCQKIHSALEPFGNNHCMHNSALFPLHLT